MKIHFIAIGGAVMHQMAIDLAVQGHEVTGSDDEIFDPARTNLEKYGILPAAVDWDADRITPDIDAIVLGMHAHEDNPELKRALELDIDIYSFPEFVYNQTMDSTRVSISGSHGKTTTTAMVMHVLKDQKMDFDYLVGSKLEDFERSVSLHGAPILIAEGDEYPASSLQRVPKFLFLKPQIAVITGIAWDHVNIFPTYENYFHQFELFLESMEPDDVIIYNTEDPEVVRCIESAGGHLQQIGYRALPHSIDHGITTIYDTHEQGYPVEVFGRHNMSNMAAAKLVCAQLGVAEEDFCKSIQRFGGTAKRLELLRHTDAGFVYRDFAHAPSKVKATLDAVREQFKGFSIVACLELHTYSSLNINFMKDYAHSLDGADHRSVFYSHHALDIKRLPDFEPEEVIKNFEDDELHVFTERAKLEEYLKGISDRPVVYLMMSSGNYDGMSTDFMASLIDAPADPQ